MTAAAFRNLRNLALKPAENLTEQVFRRRRKHERKPAENLTEPLQNLRNVCPPYPYALSAPPWGGREAPGQREIRRAPMTGDASRTMAARLCARCHRINARPEPSPRTLEGS
jgi:hypothetical protein